MNDTAEKLAKEFVEYKQIKKAAEKALADLQEQMIELLGESESMTAGMFTVTNSTFSRKQFNSSALKADNPALYDKYCEQVTRTRFNVAV